MTWADMTAIGFEVLGLLTFLVSIAAWGINFRRARKAGILDYSMFTLHPAFLLCAVFTAVMLGMAVDYFLHSDVTGFRVSIGAAVIFLSVLVWNTGFVTKAGLYLTGTKCIPLTAKRENGLILLTAQSQDLRASKPIVYENSAENREKFAALLQKESTS